MDLENIMFNERSYTEKDKYYITSMWNLKNNTSECAKQKQTDRYRRQTCVYQSEEERGEGQVKGIELTDTNYSV